MRTNPLDMTGRTVIVTGATMGLGRVIAARFLEHGADVVLFCASPLASYMSGASVPVHGGGEGPAYLAASTGAVTGETADR